MAHLTKSGFGHGNPPLHIWDLPATSLENGTKIFKVPAVVSLSRAPLHFWSVLLHTFSFLHGCRRDRRLSDMPFLLLEMVTSPSLVSFKVLFSPVDSCAHIASVACFVWVEFFLGRQSTAYPKIAYRRVTAVSSQEVLA